MPAEGARGVLITRPEPGAGETAARLTAMGWRPVLAPVLRIVPGRVVAPARVQAVLVTSGNAIPALPHRLHEETLFAVGDATAARARRAGFADVRSAGADAAALARLVRDACDPAAEALLLASGAGQGQGLAAELRGAGFHVVHRVAYAATPIPELPAPAVLELRDGHIGAVLVFSPETAWHLVALLRAGTFDTRRIEALAISDAAASILALLPWRRIRVAAQVNQTALLELLS